MSPATEWQRQQFVFILNNFGDHLLTRPLRSLDAFFVPLLPVDVDKNAKGVKTTAGSARSLAAHAVARILREGVTLDAALKHALVAADVATAAATPTEQLFRIGTASLRPLYSV